MSAIENSLRTCSICLENFEPKTKVVKRSDFTFENLSEISPEDCTPIQLICDHVFHSSCLVPCLMEFKNKTTPARCPNCKTVIMSKDNSFIQDAVVPSAADAFSNTIGLSVTLNPQSGIDDCVVPAASPGTLVSLSQQHAVQHLIPNETGGISNMSSYGPQRCINNIFVVGVRSASPPPMPPSHGNTTQDQAATDTFSDIQNQNAIVPDIDEFDDDELIFS